MKKSVKIIIGIVTVLIVLICILSIRQIHGFLGISFGSKQNRVEKIMDKRHWKEETSQDYVFSVFSKKNYKYYSLPVDAVSFIFFHNKFYKVNIDFVNNDITKEDFDKFITKVAFRYGLISKEEKTRSIQMLRQYTVDKTDKVYHDLLGNEFIFTTYYNKDFYKGNGYNFHFEVTNRFIDKQMERYYSK